MAIDSMTTDEINEVSGAGIGWDWGRAFRAASGVNDTAHKYGGVWGQVASLGLGVDQAAFLIAGLTWNGH